MGRHIPRREGGVQILQTVQVEKALARIRIAGLLRIPDKKHSCARGWLWRKIRADSRLQRGWLLLTPNVVSCSQLPGRATKVGRRWQRQQKVVIGQVRIGEDLWAGGPDCDRNG